MDLLTGVQHISVSMATKCLHNILHNKRIEIKTLPCKQILSFGFTIDSLCLSLCIPVQNVHINTHLSSDWMSCAHSVFGLYLPRLTTMMKFIHEDHFLRCKCATDITSSMQCSRFFSMWPTSAPEIAVLRSLLPILFFYFIAPATALQTGGKEDSMAQEWGAGGSHELSIYWFCFLITSLNFWKHRAVLCENCHHDGHSRLQFPLIIMAFPVNYSNWSEQ